MEDSQQYNLYAIDANTCPENDEPIIDKQCSGCEFYKGFELYNGQRCIKCSDYHEKEIVK
jgi:hypothetical protein